MSKEIIEVIELLEKAKTKLLCTDDRLRPLSDIQQALTKLREQPPVGEWTKIMREKWLPKPINIDRILSEAVSTIAVALDHLDRAEAINKDLLEACEKVQDWLDTSSLQQILVHYTEDKRRHALIMGIASNLERLEAAIAKAKKEG